MPISKTGSEYIKEAGAEDLGTLLTRWGKAVVDPTRLFGRTAKRVGKGVARASKSMGRGAIRAGEKGLSGAGRAGKFIYDNPKVSFPAAILGVSGLYGAGDSLKKNILHANPDVDLTEYRPSWKIKPEVQYRNERVERYMRNKNIYY